MMELLADPHAWVALLTLIALELVLGIDNIVFISIIVDKLPAAQQERARRIGLFMAMFMRIGLLFLLTWLVGLTAPIFSISAVGQELSGRDLILIGGGLFLLWKTTGEIRDSLTGIEGHAPSAAALGFASAIVQIMVIDLVFSLDSIITAVGMVDQIEIMIAAVVVSIGMMMAFASAIGRFVSANPTIKMLALAFLVVVGVVLIADGLGQHIPKGYIYFAMAFSLGVELLNIRARRRSRRATTAASAPAPAPAEPAVDRPR